MIESTLEEADLRLRAPAFPILTRSAQANVICDGSASVARECSNLSGRNRLFVRKCAEAYKDWQKAFAVAIKPTVPKQ
jgi:hypothetical protein